MGLTWTGPARAHACPGQLSISWFPDLRGFLFTRGETKSILVLKRVAPFRFSPSSFFSFLFKLVLVLKLI